MRHVLAALCLCALVATPAIAQTVNKGKRSILQGTLVNGKELRDIPVLSPDDIVRKDFPADTPQWLPDPKVLDKLGDEVSCLGVTLRLPKDVKALKGVDGLFKSERPEDKGKSEEELPYHIAVKVRVEKQEDLTQKRMWVLTGPDKSTPDLKIFKYEDRLFSTEDGDRDSIRYGIVNGIPFTQARYTHQWGPKEANIKKCHIVQGAILPSQKTLLVTVICNNFDRIDEIQAALRTIKISAELATDPLLHVEKADPQKLLHPKPAIAGSFALQMPDWKWPVEYAGAYETLVWIRSDEGEIRVEFDDRRNMNDHKVPVLSFQRRGTPEPQNVDVTILQDGKIGEFTTPQKQPYAFFAHKTGVTAYAFIDKKQVTITCRVPKNLPRAHALLRAVAGSIRAATPEELKDAKNTLKFWDGADKSEAERAEEKAQQDAREAEAKARELEKTKNADAVAKIKAAAAKDQAADAQLRAAMDILYKNKARVQDLKGGMGVDVRLGNVTNFDEAWAALKACPDVKFSAVSIPPEKFSVAVKKDLAAMPQVELLELSFTDDKPSGSLDDLPCRTRVKFYSNRCKDDDLRILEKAGKNLDKVELVNTTLTDAALVHLKDLNLPSLRISLCRDISGKGLDGLKMNAGHLIFDKSGVTDESVAVIAKVSGVSVLEIRNAEVTDACLPLLTANPSLQRVLFTNTKVTAEAARKASTAKCTIAVTVAPSR